MFDVNYMCILHNKKSVSQPVLVLFSACDFLYRSFVLFVGHGFACDLPLFFLVSFGLFVHILSSCESTKLKSQNTPA